MTTNVDLTLREAQQAVDDWIAELGVRYFDPLTNLSQLTEEVGELARLLSRLHGEQSFKPGREPVDPTAAVADELADVLFVTICLANQSGIDLTEALRANLAKKTQRDSKRHKANPKLTTEPRTDAVE